MLWRKVIWFVINYWTEELMLGLNKAKDYINNVIDERINNWYNVIWIVPKWLFLKYTSNIYPMIEFSIIQANFASAEIEFYNSPYSIRLKVRPIYNELIE